MICRRLSEERRDMRSSSIVTYWRSFIFTTNYFIYSVLCGIADMLSVARRNEDGSVHDYAVASSTTFLSSSVSSYNS